MSASVVRVLVVLCCSIIAYCNAGKNITAYIKQSLLISRCVSVPSIRSVCDVDWLVRETDAEFYADMIEGINGTISSSALHRGLNAGDAMHCRMMYENMICKDTFPVCDLKRMVVDYGDTKKRCDLAKDACTSISIQGCEHSTTGVKALISDENKCEAVATNTFKLCPGTTLRVPKTDNVLAQQVVEHLSTIAETFSKDLKNRTITATCEMKYREVLCRLVDACSSDGFEYLHFISKEECEKMISCVKSAGFSSQVTSVCSKIPSMEDAESIIVPNPYSPKKKIFSTISPTSGITDHVTRKTIVLTETVISSEPTRKDIVPTTEILEVLSEEGNVANPGALGNTKSNRKPTGSGHTNHQNFPLCVLALILGLAVRLFC